MFGFIVSLLVPLSEEDARNDLEHETAEDDEVLVALEWSESVGDVLNRI